jgi:hypothetical protein
MAWTGLDFELGSQPVDSAYWHAIDSGADYNLLKKKMRHDNPIWSVITNEF